MINKELEIRLKKLEDKLEYEVQNITNVLQILYRVNEEKIEEFEKGLDDE